MGLSVPEAYQPFMRLSLAVRDRDLLTYFSCALPQRRPWNSNATLPSEHSFGNTDEELFKPSGERQPLPLCETLPEYRLNGILGCGTEVRGS